MAVYESPGAGRVLIALADGPLEPEPTWTRYDELSTCRCEGFDSLSGRSSELDTTDTGTARVFFNDRAGTLNDDDLVGLQILLQLHDPVTDLWHPRWRGHIDDIESKTNPSAPMSNRELVCVDIFDYLGGVKMIPGVFGLPAESVGGSTFYEDGPVDTRMTTLLWDAGLFDDMFVIFSGNIDVNESQYDPDDVILQALRDGADAEFPGIANVYVDRFGRVCFHGRFARFDPDTVAGGAAVGAWDFTRWDAATGSDVTSGVAQIREFAFNRPRSRIINSYVAWPKDDEKGYEFDRSLIPGLYRTDGTSIGLYGYHGIEATSLIIKEHKTNGNTGAEECGLYGDFFIANYPVPKENVQSVVFKSIAVGDARAAATWALMTRCDISDVIALTVDEEAIVAEDYYVEGVQVSCRVGSPGLDFVTVTPNLSPASYYATDVFTP